MIMTNKKPCEKTFVPDEMLELVAEINELARVRVALNLGTQTGDRNGAESLMSRRITKRVNQLSKLILSTFKED